MIIRAPQTSGHTIFSAHIEEPNKEFFVAFYAPAYLNVFSFEAGRRWVRVLAETAEGALAVARYHYYTASNFELLNERPQTKK
jgi:hypothetical protein